MPDLESALLQEAMAFVRSRVEQLAMQASEDAEHFVTTLLGHAPPALSPALVAEVRGHLTAAHTNASAVAADLSAPVDIGKAQNAVGHAAAAIDEIDKAIQAVALVIPEVGVAENALKKMIADAVSAVGNAFSGIVEQLQIGPPGGSIASGISVAGRTVHWEMHNPARRTVAGLGLAESTLAADLEFGAAPPKLSVVLTTGATIALLSDGLLRELAHGVAGEAEVDLRVAVDTSGGFTLGVGSKQRVSIPAHFQVPGVELRDVGLELASGAAPELRVTADLAGSLGPAAATISGGGIALRIDTNSLAGHGAQPLSLAPVLPRGGGLRLDAGPLRGGGFVEHHGNEYGGALELRAGPVDVTAIALIATDPFSMVLVIGVRFVPGIQLSFGFTLNAVGGLVAVNRRLATEVLQTGFTNHTIDALLFPADPVAAAPAILQQLGAAFPQQPGAFVIGPMFELGWGAPVSFVTARVGILIALPDPKIVLLGLLRVAVPAPEVAIVDLRAAIYGEISGDGVLVIADLSGSKVAGFALAGQIGFLIGVGEHPELAFSAGGFHPGYHDRPPQLASLQRVSVDISPPSIFTLRAEGYLALTSNSFQLGARVELRAEVGSVGAEGHIGFDAMVVWSPTFAFVADLEAGVSLHAFGETFASVDLHLHLEGPGPWIAQGTASVKILFLRVELPAGPIRWGEEQTTPPELVSPQTLVVNALKEAGAWAARLPAGAEMLVTLRPEAPGDAPAGTIAVHPLGGFEARQQAVPLETQIDRVGRHPVSERRVNLGQPTLNGSPAPVVSHATDHFAPGQFLDLSDDQKLGRPAFEDFPAGIRIAGGSGDAFGAPVESPYEWETVFPHRPPPRKPRIEVMILLEAARQTWLAAAPAALAAAQVNPYSVEPRPVTVADPGLKTVRDRDTLEVAAGASGALLTTTEAAGLVASLGHAGLELVGPGVAA